MCEFLSFFIHEDADRNCQECQRPSIMNFCSGRCRNAWKERVERRMAIGTEMEAEGLTIEDARSWAAFKKLAETYGDATLANWGRGWKIGAGEGETPYERLSELWYTPESALVDVMEPMGKDNG